MGNNSVCWESGDSSSLVQRFLSMVHERELRQWFCPMIPFQKKMSALLFLFSMQLDETWCLSLHQASCFRVLSLMLPKNFILQKVFILGHILETHLQISLLSKKHSNGRKQWLLPESRCVPVMSSTYDFPALTRTGKPYIIVPYYFPYQQLSPAFPEVLPRNLNRIWCFSLPDRNLPPFQKS